MKLLLQPALDSKQGGSQVERQNYIKYATKEKSYIPIQNSLDYEK